MQHNYLTNMFKTPCLHISILDWDYKKLKLLELSNSQKFSLKNNSEFIDTTFYYANDNCEEEENLSFRKEILNILKDEIQIFENTFNLIVQDIDLAWFQIQKQNMYHSIHNHGYGKFSVVCYLEFNQQFHTPTHFLSPHNNLFTGQVDYFVPPNVKEGSIIFFPSSINHFTLPNHSEVERKILSFNINFKWK